MTNYIDERDFDIIGSLEDEMDALERFYEYSMSDSYITDVFAEISDEYTPIYYNDLWDTARDIQDKIEEALAEFGSTDDLMKLFQTGYYKYYNDSLHENIETLAFNYVAREIDSFINGLDIDPYEELDIEGIVDRIEEATAGIDSNNKISALRYVIGEIMEEIKEGEFGLAETEI